MGFVEKRVEELRSAAGADRGETEMPLKTTEDDDPRRLVKIKFIVNTSDGGEDYGPDYPKKVAQVPFNRAAGYIRQGRAVAQDGDEELKEIEESSRDGGQLPEEKTRRSGK